MIACVTVSACVSVLTALFDLPETYSCLIYNNLKPNSIFLILLVHFTKYQYYGLIDITLQKDKNLKGKFIFCSQGYKFIEGIPLSMNFYLMTRVDNAL